MLRALSRRVVAASSSSMTLRRAMATLAPLDASKLTITKTSSPKEKLPKEKLVFGRTFTDHMLTIKYHKDSGWDAPAIVPYGNLSLSPASNSLHYAIECFEGMKAYIDAAGKIRLFRPDRNMERLNNSARRIQLPEFDGDQLIECLKALLRIDKDWIPRQRGYSLYIRPTLIGTQDSLGVGPSNSALLYVILSPVGPYYASGFEPVNLFASDKYVRAWPGGTGNTKLGCNYAPGILPQVLAAKDGFAQILWLFGEKHNITEVGTMNAFTVWKNKSGARELITPPLDGTILPGVTRDSILQLAKNWKDISVLERPYTIHDVLEALEEKRLLEFFGAGTAAIVAPVKGIQYNDKLYQIPLDTANPAAKAGPIASRLLEEIMAIQYGEVPNHPWSVVVD